MLVYSVQRLYYTTVISYFIFELAHEEEEADASLVTELSVLYEFLISPRKFLDLSRCIFDPLISKIL